MDFCLLNLIANIVKIIIDVFNIRIKVTDHHKTQIRRFLILVISVSLSLLLVSVIRCSIPKDYPAPPPESIEYWDADISNPLKRIVIKAPLDRRETHQ